MSGDSNTFTIYLPSNSAGATPMSESESKNDSVSSWYKTNLDQTYELSESDWQVGLCEVCFPSTLLSDIEEDFVVGIRIMNPIKNWLKKERMKYINTFEPDLTDDQYKTTTTFLYLDSKFECVGDDKESMIGLNTYSINTPGPTFKKSATIFGITTNDLVSALYTVGFYYDVATDLKEHQDQLRRKQEASQSHVPISEIVVDRGLKGNPRVELVQDPDTVPEEGMVTAETAKGTVDPSVVDEAMYLALLGKTGRVGDFWYKRRLFEVANGEHLDVENCDEPNLSTIKAGFFSTRAELVAIINQRLQMLLHTRTYPASWANALVEPQLVVRDTGLVTVACGFGDSFSGATSDSLHLVPVISSLKVIRFLGLDPANWIKDEKLKMYVFTVRGTSYLRRDSVTPITLVRDEKMQRPKNNVNPTATFELRLTHDMMELCTQFVYNTYEKQYRDKDNKRFPETQLLSMVKSPKYQSPQFIYVQSDIASPVAIGSSRASILRITTLKQSKTVAGKQKVHKSPEKFIRVFFSPIARKAFSSIEVFLSDENGSELVFDQGTVYVVLEFRRAMAQPLMLM